MVCVLSFAAAEEEKVEVRFLWADGEEKAETIVLRAFAGWEKAPDGDLRNLVRH